MVLLIGFWFLLLNSGIGVCYGIHERSMKVFTREGLMCRIHYKVWILCNDTTEAYFHILGKKCGHCRSYDTRAISSPVLPQ
ncbi:unnamed protein product [Lupinus luteus]|uniref:RCHY1 zinc-ribbon domain-containing protein n=1 Tax=Lupinus luteus TaxID=3873 RepID=A0AAV1WJW2_LUPLU